ncbi:hypothetical protein GN244_ATG12506 [Phytophthora infestans]|uniref:Uncharacterized protein n=1 Tax=Phytophthora infestans TaxID=4787 RepID=A0A833WB28_PHYIN|nr:hypothetical protein GN244_ATG12506 [Phytophthora infestans]
MSFRLGSLHLEQQSVSVSLANSSTVTETTNVILANISTETATTIATISTGSVTTSSIVTLVYSSTVTTTTHAMLDNISTGAATTVATTLMCSTSANTKVGLSSSSAGGDAWQEQYQYGRQYARYLRQLQLWVSNHTRRDMDRQHDSEYAHNDSIVTAAMLATSLPFIMTATAHVVLDKSSDSTLSYSGRYTYFAFSVVMDYLSLAETWGLYQHCSDCDAVVAAERPG